MHISCAINTDCKYFITTDYKLINKEIKEIRVVNPINFIDEERI
jgi:predicted nucleic acid-binding protein